MYYLMRLAMGRLPAVDATVTLPVLIKACEEAREKAEDTAWIVGNQLHAEAPGRNASNAIYLSDFTSDERFVQLQLVRGNPTVGRPNFANVAKRKVTKATTADPDAVPAVSAVLVIDRSVQANEKGQHRMVLERAQGLGKSLVRDYLATLLHRYAVRHPDEFVAERKVKKKGKREVIAYHPTIRLHPQQNASLKHDLEEGKIGGFSLMRGEAKYSGPVDEAKVLKTNVRLQVKLAPTGSLDDVYKTIRNMRDAMSGQIDFEGYKLALEDGDGSSHPTQLMPMETIDTEDMRYCRTVTADGFDDELEQCYPVFHPEIVSRAKGLISNSRYWKREG
jgi:hypothetical protein